MAAENFKVKKGLEVGTAITATSSGINVTGVITATQLVGDGSGLTGVVGSGSGVVVKDEGSAVGTAGTINFVGSGVAATLSAGTATVTINAGTTTINNNANNRLITGSGTANTLEAESGLTYDGTYFNHIGSGFKQLKIDTSTGNSASLLLKNSTGNFTVNTINNAGNRNFTIYDGTAGVTRFNINQGGTVGITSGLNVTGVSTFASAIDANGDLDVDGQTNLDDVRISGVTTMTGTLQGNIGSFTGAVSGTTGTFSGNISGPQLNISAGSGNDGIILLNSGGGQNNDFSRIRQVVSDDSFRIENKSSGSYESLLTGIGGAGVKLYFAGTEKFETTGTGIASPNISVSGVGTFSTRIDTNGVSFGTNSTTFAAKFLDDAVINVGTNNDLKIYHDDGNGLTYIRNDGTGPLDIRSINDINIRDGNDGDLFIKCEESEGVSLHYEGAEKLITDVAGVKITGVATATSFSGSAAGLTNIPSAQLSGALPALDGSALTGVTASGTGIIIQHDGSNVGTAGTINFSTNLDVSPVSAGIVTITASGGSSTQDKIEEGNSFAEVVGISTGDGEFKVVLQDFTSSGAGATTLRLYQSANDTNKLDLFSHNTSNKAVIEIKSIYAGTGRHQIKFVTNNSSYGGELDFLASTGSWNFYSKYQNNNKNIISFNHNTIGVGDDVFPTTNNAFDLGFSSHKFRNFHVTNVQAGIVTAATRFVGSGVSLTSLNADELDSGTIPNGRFPATLPAASGANLTNLPVPTQITVADESSDTSCNILFSTDGTGNIAPKTGSNLTFNSSTGLLVASGFSGDGSSLTNLPAANLTGTLPAISGANLTGIAVTESPVTSYTILGSSSSPNYYLSGGGVDESDGNPDLYLIRGQRYRFYNATGTGHPFRFTGTGNKNDTYSDGVTGSESGTQFFTVPHDAPAKLFYVCTIHSSMVGNIYIRGANGNNENVGFTTFTGDITIKSSTPLLRLTDTDTSGPLHCDIESASGDLYLDTGSVHRDVIITSVGKTNEIARFTGDGKVAITSRGTVEGESKLNVEIPARTTAFSASDGDTWHDVLIENPGAATNNAVGLCFQVTGDTYHKNAGTGIAAVKNGTNSDYGADLVFITRPQNAVAEERLRIDSSGQIIIGGDSSVGTKLHIENSSGDAHIRLRGSANYGVLFTRHSDGALTGYVGSGNAVNLGSSNVALSAPLSGGDIVFQTGGTASSNERLRITSGGNVIIGNTSPLTDAQLTLSDDDAPALAFQRSGSGKFESAIGMETNSALRFYVGADSSTVAGLTEAMQIDANGRLRIGAGAIGNTNIKGSSGTGNEGIYLEPGNSAQFAVSNGPVMALNRKTTEGRVFEVRYNGSVRGYFDTDGSSLPSDKNYKTDISDLNLGLSFVNKLKPSQFRYKDSESTSPILYGLIAQDVEESLTSEGVSKNSTKMLQYKVIEDDDNESDYYLDYQKLTPVLINAVKELSTEIDKLKAEIAALKSS